VIVTLAALLVPASALARGGHGHAGHCGHGHAGHAGFGRHGSVGNGSRNANYPWLAVGRPFPWLPAPFVVTGGQFMQCSGETIAPGASPQTVRRACGEPTLMQRSQRSTPTGKQIVEVWSYARPNQITRNLRFESGVVASIDTVHRPNR